MSDTLKQQLANGKAFWHNEKGEPVEPKPYLDGFALATSLGPRWLPMPSQEWDQGVIRPNCNPQHVDDLQEQRAEPDGTGLERLINKVIAMGRCNDATDTEIDTALRAQRLI